MIELLVVIAIIGLLSTIVLVALGAARDKGKAASVRSEVREFASLMQLEYNDSNGSYTNLSSGGWIKTAAACDAAFAGGYVNNARSICKQIVSQNGGSANTQGLYISANQSGHVYSIMAYLPDTKTLFCAGSSGGTSDTTAYTSTTFTAPGCNSNP